MKKTVYSTTTILLMVLTLSLSSCLKDSSYVDFSKVGTIVEFPLGGTPFFASTAVTDAGPAITKQFAVNIASPTVPTTATSITVGVDNTIITAYDASDKTVNYLPMPTGSYVFPDTKVTIAAGSRTAIFTVTIDKSKLDPSLSYMLPITIKDASGLPISGNQGTMYYHFIGNDFAGSYIWDYRRWQNGTGPGKVGTAPAPVVPAIPSQGQGLPPDISSIGQAGVILPVTPTEFAMLTGYNGTGVNYDVTFTRTPGTPITYTNWAVTFNAANIALWTAAGITNMVPPAFTLPPPADSTQPKFFELNYVSGGASARYIDDTYHH